jgi:anti-sigma factor RsiW
MDVPIADLLSRRGSADNIALLDAFLAQAAAAKREELEIAAANAAERAAQEPDAAADAPPAAPASKMTAEDSRRSEELLRLVIFLFHSDKSLVEHCTEVLDSARIVECIGRVSRRRSWLVQSSSQVTLGKSYVIQLFALIVLRSCVTYNILITESLM